MKKDEIRCIGNKAKSVITGIAESKLNLEVNLPGYYILRCERNRDSGGVACYIRKDLCLNTRTLHCNETENLIFDILSPKSKSLTIGVFSRPPNQAMFVDLMKENFSNLNSKENEIIYLLGDFNINLLQNKNYIRKEKEVLPLKDHSVV